MTDLRIFRMGVDGTSRELRGSTALLEVHLQRRVEADMAQMLGVRLVASEYPTGPLHQGRIDTLGLDESNCPVVIEYKKDSSGAVLSQGISYLSWLGSAKHDFEALVDAALGSDAGASVDWRDPRLICIAADFSRHDRHAVHEMPARIDLVKYRIFDDDLLNLQLVETSTGTPRALGRSRRSSKSSISGSVAAESPASTVGDPVVVPDCLRDLYGELRRTFTETGDVEERPLQHYVVFRRMVNRACVLFRSRQGVMVVYLRLDPGFGGAGGRLYPRHARHRTPRHRRPRSTDRFLGRVEEGNAAHPPCIGYRLTRRRGIGPTRHSGTSATTTCGLPRLQRKSQPAAHASGPAST